VREKDDTHTAYFLPEVQIRKTGDIKKDVVLITQAIADVQARFISQRPDLWLWIHRRWKIQPDEKEQAYYSEILSHSGNNGAEVK
jgi:KDO2-lipid IV(A) lauroyltransferase